MTNGKSGYWNVWWSLAILSALVGVMAVLLEYHLVSLKNEIVPVLERIERLLIERLPNRPSL